MPTDIKALEKCRDCQAVTTWIECEKCYKPICHDCAISCAGDCGSTKEYCAGCALNVGFEKHDHAWYCENCAPEEAEPEHECNDCGIMIPSWRPICTLCEKWYEERGMELPK